MQYKWVSKLLDYNFVVQYKEGYENRVVDALSRKGEEEIAEMALLYLILISIPTLELLNQVK